MLTLEREQLLVTMMVLKNKTKIKDNVFIGSNSSLVTQLQLMKMFMGAGSVITKNVRKKSLTITESQSS